MGKNGRCAGFLGIFDLNSYKSPIFFARAMALVRLLTSNLLLMFLVCVFTVFREMKSKTEEQKRADFTH